MKDVISVYIENTYKNGKNISSAKEKIIQEPSWLWVKIFTENLGLGWKKVVHGTVDKSIWPELPRLNSVKLVDWLDKQSEKDVLIAALDNPMVPRKEMNECLKFHRKSGMDATLFVTDNKLSTGAGFYKREFLMKLLAKFNMELTMYELYKELLDFVSAGISRYWISPSHLLPANNCLNRATLTKIITKAIIKNHLYNEVNISLDSGILIGPYVTIGKGTEILPGTILLGTTAIGENCEIGPNSRLENAVVGNNTLVRSSHIENSTVGEHTSIGPMSHIRPDSVIGNNVKIGNFVEIKNTIIGEKTTVSHLTYVGDSHVGRNCNFGCGSVTVNYDGVEKHRTTIEDNVFVGCNTNLVAPVTMGEGSYSAAGSTITEDVPPYALAIGRPRQTNKENWVKKREEENKKKQE